MKFHFMKHNQKTLLILLCFNVTMANAQVATSFVAGWDFDDTGTTATSMTANWGDLAGSAVLAWTHSVASPPPPPFTPAEFGISPAFNSPVVGNTFAFVDPITGFDEFSDPGGAAEAGFQSLSSGDTFTFTFDATAYETLQLTYAVDTGSGFEEAGPVDLSNLAGNATASYMLNTVDGYLYDNFAITGTLADASDGSLFILENDDSFLLTTDWYRTPMGDLYVGDSPWIWSNDYGWHYSGPENTTDTAYVYIQLAPFQTSVYVDQASASSDGFWGYAYSASDPALNGWFYFFNPESTESTSEYYIWDDEGEQLLTYSDLAD
jgi:hypothetical protein